MLSSVQDSVSVSGHWDERVGLAVRPQNITDF